MPTPRALIVDDSRTAQLKLKRLLHRYQLEVDLATSAEEALGYLSYRMPSVIFMDHHMEGMDGFEALKIIKANPATATIPVIMYTSQSNDVYASQAHALGALDTLSKNLMRPSRIEEVLAKLDITPQDDDTPNAARTLARQATEEAISEAQAHKQSDNMKEENDLSSSEFKAQIARLFELHVADIRSQVTENTKFVVRRLTAEIKNANNKEHSFDDIPLSILNEEARAETHKITVVSNTLLVLILVALAAISFQIFQNYQQSALLDEKYDQLADISYQESLLLDDLVSSTRRDGNARGEPTKISTVASEPSITPTAAPAIQTGALFKTIGWAISLDMHFPYGEAPLAEKRVIDLQNLTFKLHQAGFKGFIELSINLGNFCLQRNADGELVLPAENTPISECEFVKDQKLDLSAESFTSVSYLQFEQSAAPIQSGDIEFIISMGNFDNPIFAYPSPRGDITAGRWNRIAQQNQQIVVTIDTN